MRAYLVSVPDPSNPNYIDAMRMEPSKDKAISARVGLAKATGYAKSSVKIEEIDLPSTKAELIDFINGLIRKLRCA